MSEKQVVHLSPRKQSYAHYIQHSLDQAGGVHNEMGHYATVRSTGHKTMDECREVKNGLHRSARKMGHSVFWKIKNAADGTYNVEFTVVDKAKAREFIAAKKNRGESLAYIPRGSK